MGFIFSGLFWGGILILLGVSVVLNALFRVRIPFFRLFLAFLCFYIGVSVLVGPGSMRRSSDTVVFESRKMSGLVPGGKYDVVFGEGDFDFSGTELKERENRVEVTTVFGGSEIWIDQDVPTRIEVSSAFGEARLPDRNSVVFGSRTYESPGYRSDTNHLLIKAAVVFGDLEIRKRAVVKKGSEE
jgi:predicted membrane protein